MSRLIDAFELSNAVIESMNNNPHTDSIVRKTHKHEHEHFLRMIQLAPTIESAPIRHGQWKCVIEIIPYVFTGQCSECGQCDFVKNYCPNCGAKMNEED